ncbi:unnamed protein product [Rhizophagus irregularis]|uniref:Uncharacterized protein n=1 Tax=Rhizophagus irregularis TaxID=588596 RepID=A0A2I1HES8_9GLOM|nr:hypothetical protein RhiirA4_509690 [Rhizophagus irregularis]CAB4403855.1 unnamed protein product [Rhizophagus irregularis]CAB4404498.1 unnamed protein product [Rhizophagus irregularis]
MAKLYVKKGACMEEKTHEEVEPNDRVTQFSHKKMRDTLKRSEVPDDVWRRAIAEKDTLIIIDKVGSDVCSAVKGKYAQNDICHIIGKWYEDLKVDYNIGLPDNKKVRNIGWLHDQLTIDRRVKTRVGSIVQHYGMTVEDVNLLFLYKIARNNEVHKDTLNRGATVPQLSQQLRNALKLLDEAPNQSQDFPRGVPDGIIEVTKLIFFV